MKTPKMPRVFVSGQSYAVYARAGYIKADLNGYYGWVSVWADDYDGLKRRIRQVRSGGQ
jgi:hypothetical protein